MLKDSVRPACTESVKKAQAFLSREAIVIGVKRGAVVVVVLSGRHDRNVEWLEYGQQQGTYFQLDLL